MARSFRVAIAVCLGLTLVLLAGAIAFAGSSPGAAAFGQYCAACHGNNGQGTAYAPNIQGESAGDIIETAREGDDGMPAFPSTTISDSTLQSIASYVSSLGNAGNDQYGAGGSQYGRHGDHGGHRHDGHHNQHGRDGSGD